MSHPEPLHLQAYFDGELHTLAAVEIEQHLQLCDTCRQQLQALESLRTELRENLMREAAPDSLRQRLDSLLAAEDDSAAARRSAVRVHPAFRHRLNRSGWPFGFGVLSGGALAAAAALVVLGWSPSTSRLPDELVSAYVRSMMSTHPIDVVSSDHHTVKPWFGGHAAVSPVVADFDAQGYRLIGGRADYIEHQRAAVLVYQHGAHTIDVFSWSTGARPLSELNVTRDGYHIACWRVQELNYCAVSDTGWDELRTLQGLLRNLSAGDQP